MWQAVIVALEADHGKEERVEEEHRPHEGVEIVARCFRRALERIRDDTVDAIPRLANATEKAEMKSFGNRKDRGTVAVRRIMDKVELMGKQLTDVTGEYIEAPDSTES